MVFAYNFLTVIFIALVTIIIIFLSTKRYHLALWGAMAAVAPDWPNLLTLLGATYLQNVTLLTHTIGIFIFPVFLVIADILLLEMAFFKYVKPFKKMLPLPVRNLINLEDAIERLQKYNTLPKPDKVQLVYTVALAGGIIHVLVNIIFEFL